MYDDAVRARARIRRRHDACCGAASLLALANGAGCGFLVGLPVSRPARQGRGRGESIAVASRGRGFCVVCAASVCESEADETFTPKTG